MADELLTLLVQVNNSMTFLHDSVEGIKHKRKLEYAFVSKLGSFVDGTVGRLYTLIGTKPQDLHPDFEGVNL